MKSFDGQYAHIPNVSSFSQTVLNYTTSGKRRIVLSVGVHYDSDLEKVERVAFQALHSLDKMHPQHGPEIYFYRFGDSSIDFYARLWVDPEMPGAYFEVRSKAIIAIKKAFDENEITIPFPIRTLDF